MVEPRRSAGPLCLQKVALLSRLGSMLAGLWRLAWTSAKPPHMSSSIMTNETRTKILLALFWLALAFAVTMALLPKPPHMPFDRFGDKFEHMLAFGVLAGLGVGAFPTLPLSRLAERLSFLGALIEVTQSIPALHRDCDIWDWVADTLAVILVMSAVHVYVSCNLRERTNSLMTKLLKSKRKLQQD